MARILIADDSPTEVYALQAMPEKNGHVVLTARDSEQAIRQTLETKSDLMDVVMPNLNGFQATRKLSRAPETRHIPIVIVSAKNQKTDKLWGLRQGARGYLGKPVNKQALVQQINTLPGR